MPDQLRFTILGEPASKANQRKLVSIGGKPALIKSDKALAYEDSAVRQIPSWARVQLEGPVCVTMTLFYASERPDLDESIVLDILQDRYSKQKKDKAGNVVRPRTLLAKGVYHNDRQVRERHVFHAIDARNPRAEILVEPRQAQQEGLL